MYNRLSQPRYPVKFLTTDILIVDIVTELSGNARLEALVQKYNLLPGRKYQIASLQEVQEYAAALQGFPTKTFPGGSSSNMLRTMKLMAPELVKGKFVGALGKDIEGQMINASFAEAGVELLLINKAVPSETAISFVIKWPDGERCIVTYPGNAKQILTPDVFTEDLIAETDEIILQGSTLRKLVEQGIHDILKYRWQYTKGLYLAAPTSAFRPDYFDWLQTSADGVLSNTDEMGYIMREPVAERRAELDEYIKLKRKNDPTYSPLDDPKAVRLDEAVEEVIPNVLRKLQKQQQRDSDRILKTIGHEPQVAMITDGAKGAYLVTSSDIQQVAAPDVVKVNSLGSGDNAFAGFTLGKRVLRMSNLDSVRLAMTVATAKLRYDGAVMDNPVDRIKEMFPMVGRDLEEKLANCKVGITSPSP